MLMCIRILVIISSLISMQHGFNNISIFDIDEDDDDVDEQDNKDYDRLDLTISCFYVLNGLIGIFTSILFPDYLFPTYLFLMLTTVGFECILKIMLL